MMLQMYDIKPKNNSPRFAGGDYHQTNVSEMYSQAW